MVGEVDRVEMAVVGVYSWRWVRRNMLVEVVKMEAVGTDLGVQFRPRMVELAQLVVRVLLEPTLLLLLMLVVVAAAVYFVAMEEH
jgi:hypothetical protein